VVRNFDVWIPIHANARTFLFRLWLNNENQKDRRGGLRPVVVIVDMNGNDEYFALHRSVVHAISLYRRWLLLSPFLFPLLPSPFKNIIAFFFPHPIL